MIILSMLEYASTPKSMISESLQTLWWSIIFQILQVDPLSMRFCAMPPFEMTANVPQEGELDDSASIHQNVMYLESWSSRVDRPMWVGLWRDSAHVNSLSPWGRVAGRNRDRRVLTLVCFGHLLTILYLTIFAFFYFSWLKTRRINFASCKNLLAAKELNNLIKKRNRTLNLRLFFFEITFSWTNILQMFSQLPHGTSDVISNNVVISIPQLLRLRSCVVSNRRNIYSIYCFWFKKYSFIVFSDLACCRLRSLNALNTLN